MSSVVRAEGQLKPLNIASGCQMVQLQWKTIWRVSQKWNIMITMSSTKSTFRYMTTDVQHKSLNRYLWVNVHDAIVHGTSKVKVWNMFFMKTWNNIVFLSSLLFPCLSLFSSSPTIFLLPLPSLRIHLLPSPRSYSPQIRICPSKETSHFSVHFLAFMLLPWN